MMTKECTCKRGKKDPKCPACSKDDVNLDSFHRLNPEARPKTAEQFKLAGGRPPGGSPLPTQTTNPTPTFDPGPPADHQRPGLWGGLPKDTRKHLIGAGKAGLQNALVPAAGAALIAGMTAQPGHGVEDAAKAGLAVGGLSTIAGAGHQLGMTGTSDFAHSYQRGVGGDIRNMGNWARDQAGAPRVAHPNTPPAPPETPKAAMFYEFGKSAALADFDA